MRSRAARHGPRRAVRLAAVAVVWVACTIAPLAQGRAYKPKNGVLNWKAVVFGGGFRVTSAIPLHGNFARYTRVAIVRPTSLVGPDVPPSVLARLTRGLVAEFQKGGRFADASVADAVTLPTYHPPTAGAPPPAAASFRAADPLDAPMRSWSDLVAFDRQRAAAAASGATTSGRTLVVRCEVIDYTKGNKWLQFLALDLGNSILTLRFSYYDETTGEELGRTVVSSDNSSSVIPSAFSTRNALTGVIEGLVDQVTRRKLAGER